MNVKIVALVLLLALLGVAAAAPQVLVGKRDFPGQRRRGSTNYGQYRWSKTGFTRKVNPSKNRKASRRSSTPSPTRAPVRIIRPSPSPFYHFVRRPVYFG